MRALVKLIKKLFKSSNVTVSEVFTPTVCASRNYIPRQRQEEKFLNNLTIPGMQIIVYGKSGSGKTTLVRNLLHKNQSGFITTKCESTTTFADIVLSGFDQLNPYFVSQKSHRESEKIDASISAEYLSISSSIHSTVSSEISDSLQRIVPPQLTVERLAKMIGECGLIWVIEDFHKVQISEKNRLADLLKIFVDTANDYENTKVICIGVSDSAQELIKLNPDIAARVAQVSIPMLNSIEIQSIVTNGCSLLNLEMEESLQDKIVYYSDRLASLAHNMCLDICQGNHIERRSRKKRSLNDDQFKLAVQGFIDRNSDTLQVIYDTAVANELGWYILKTFSSNSHEKLRPTEILRRVNYSGKGFSIDQVKEKLDQFSTEPFKVLEKHINTGFYSIANPFWHAFLRMQFAIEAAAQEDAKNNRNNRRNLRLTTIDQKSKYAIVDKLILEFLESMRQLESK